MSFIQPARAPWDEFPEVVLHAAIADVKSHEAYEAAKSGDAMAAHHLVVDCISADHVEQLQALSTEVSPTLSPVHALEDSGVNAIPLALAEELAVRLGWAVETSVVQSNLVGHTGASGFRRLARQAAFLGEVSAGTTYLLVDDFIGQGGTLANLRGHILSAGASVVGATVLTGKLHSTKLALVPETLDELRRKHGAELESWWKDRFGHTFDCLTESEARYLIRTPNADRVRARIAAE